MTNILVTEAGGVGALNIIKCLREDKSIRIISTDTQEYAVGLYKADKRYIVPKVEDATYFDTLLNICEKEDIDVVFPSFDRLISIYSKNKELFEEKGINVIVNDRETIEIASNKFLTYKKLSGFVPMPKTYRYVDLKMQDKVFPLFMKPAKASGSESVHKINSQEELECYITLSKDNIEDFVFQEYLNGTEYTVDMLCDFKGKVLSIVPRVRLEIKAGVSYKGVTVRNKSIEKIGNEIAKHLIFKGPICFQVRESADTNETKLFEINPRVCGTMVFTKEAGVNMPLLAVKLAMGEKIEREELEYKEGIVMLRYWEEMYLDTSSGGVSVYRR